MEHEKLKSILDKFLSLEKQINAVDKSDYKEFAKISKEYSDLKPLVEKINLFFKLEKEKCDLSDLLNSEDTELKREAENENDDLDHCGHRTEQFRGAGPSCRVELGLLVVAVQVCQRPKCPYDRDRYQRLRFHDLSRGRPGSEGPNDL